MNSEIKYPAILRSTIQDNQVVTVFKDGSAMHMEGNFLGQVTKGYNTDCAINITHEYLSNTWGVVESKDHSEFIVELAKLHGFELRRFGDDGLKFFHFGSSGFSLLNSAPHHIADCKQITIPSPPKEKPALVETKARYNDLSDEMKQLVIEDSINEEFELHQKQAVQNANCRCEFVDLETWPKVGDRVTVFGQQGALALPADANGMYVVKSNGRYFIPKLSDITKPKSKEDLVIEELQAKLCENNYVDNYTLANDIVNGMIEGLSYNTVKSK